MRLLLVEDDPHIAELLQEGLGEEGYDCDVASSAVQGQELARMFPYALLILDVMLPEGQDAGYQLGQQLRASGVQIPILYLTARSRVEDRVQGLDVGGDDYLGKPFALSELRARVRALIRRSRGTARNELSLPGGWLLDLASRSVVRRGTRSDLSRREFALLELFALHPGRVFTRSDIIERLWAGESGVEPKVIDVYVSIVRRKTSEDLIDTVRGVGYRLGGLLEPEARTP
ncbi:response regulator transcription factor [Deinococcus sonorensis]|uniref:Response regulator transcription factor n=2 Tax=Deinococcus sonorensis TaxID=309891 RepID=A0AAU7UDU6_9DEIO